MTDTTRTADDELLNVAKVGKYVIQPMSFGKMAIVAPKLAPLIDEIIAMFPDSVFTTSRVISCAMVMLDRFIPFLAEMLDADEAELRELPAAEGVQLLVNVYLMNQSVLASFFQIAVGLATKSPEASA